MPSLVKDLRRLPARPHLRLILLNFLLFLRSLELSELDRLRLVVEPVKQGLVGASAPLSWLGRAQRLL